MEIKKVEVIDENNIYYTIISYNKFISTKKVIELLDNFTDYIDKDKNVDLDSFKEDILGPRSYLVKKSRDKFYCTCKSALFNKNKECRHIKLVRNGENEIKQI